MENSKVAIKYIFIFIVNSFKKSAFQMLKKITDQILNEDYKSIRKAYASVSGELSNAGSKKRWIVDVDNTDIKFLDPIISTIEYLEPLEFINLNTGETKSKILGLIPTKNGYHLITSPFNRQEFSKKHSELDIHTNNPTILYIP
jgi:hypothetical protein